MALRFTGSAFRAFFRSPGRVTPYLGLGFSLRAISSDDIVLGSDTDVPHSRERWRALLALHARSRFAPTSASSAAPRRDTRAATPATR